MSQIFSKIIAFIMTVLMALFPNAFLVQRQQRDNSPEIWGPKIIEAIQEDDVEALENMMCLNIRQNVENLPEQIQYLYDCIEGEIITIEWDYGGDSYSESQQDGKAIAQVGIDIQITTTADQYFIGITWETVNNFQPEETKIRNIGLVKNYWPYDRLCLIQATDGLSCWHE